MSDITINNNNDGRSAINTNLVRSPFLFQFDLPQNMLEINTQQTKNSFRSNVV